MASFGLPTARAAEIEGPPALPVAAGVTYRLIGRWDAAKLNQVLLAEAPKFFALDMRFTPAQHGVKLYQVIYPSVVPEQGNRPIAASGLLAVPDTAGARFPLVSYQHGTVYGKQQVPSDPDQSPETALMIAQFAGQGYIVIGADYFGMGLSAEPEGYLVKAAHQQACFDMLQASRPVLQALGLSAGKLFLAGWSQGGFVTMAFLEKLQRSGVPVSGTVTASCPMDGLATLGGFLNFPRGNDASWVPVLFILTAFSFENYYGLPGLARAMFLENRYDIARAVYERQSYDMAQVPTRLHDLLRPAYFDPEFFMASAYGRLVTETLQVYRWIIQTPVRNYYGESDEVITPGVGRMAMTYQQAIGSGNTAVTALSTGKTDHRGTFMTAVPEWKRWFDQLGEG
ncbi:alpha/beta hydrolase family protein [Acidisoma sp. C75]